MPCRFLQAREPVAVLGCRAWREGAEIGWQIAARASGSQGAIGGDAQETRVLRIGRQIRLGGHQVNRALRPSNAVRTVHPERPSLGLDAVSVRANAPAILHLLHPFVANKD